MKTLRLVVCTFISAMLIYAQAALNNESIVKLAKAGLGDDLIVNMINTQPGNFSVGAEDLVALKKNGVSDKVIGAMVVKNTNPSPAVAAPAAASTTPNEVGVYYKKGAAWTDLEPEVVTFKTGGVLKSIATQGIVKGDINGHLKGSHSKTELTTPIEILIYAPEGVAATEYQLLHLRESNGDSREFRTMTGGVFHSSGGATRDAIEFEAKKIAPRTYSLSLPHLESGDYGLLPPSGGDSTGSTGRLGKLYSFHVKE